MMRAKADEILKIIDPIIGVAGKGAEVNFDLTSETIETSITNESHSAMCLMRAEVSRSEHIKGYRTGDMSVALNIDRLTSALKTFGTQWVSISSSGTCVTVENDTGRRTMRTLSPGSAPTMRDFPVSARIPADPADLKRACAFVGIGDSMQFALKAGRLSIGCSSDDETAEIFIDTDLCIDIGSFYSSELMSDIFRRIHSDGFVAIGLGEDAPVCLEFEYDCAEFRIFVAPRIETA